MRTGFPNAIYNLFAQMDGTFGRELIQMRLDCAHRLLSDARYSAVTISEVSLQSGFLEPSHFARRFRNAFGSGPMEFRATRLRGGKSAA